MTKIIPYVDYPEFNVFHTRDIDTVQGLLVASERDLSVVNLLYPEKDNVVKDISRSSNINYPILFNKFTEDNYINTDVFYTAPIYKMYSLDLILNSPNSIKNTANTNELIDMCAMIKSNDENSLKLATSLISRLNPTTYALVTNLFFIFCDSVANTSGWPYVIEDPYTAFYKNALVCSAVRQYLPCLMNGAALLASKLELFKPTAESINIFNQLTTNKSFLKLFKENPHLKIELTA